MDDKKPDYLEGCGNCKFFLRNAPYTLRSREIASDVYQVGYEPTNAGKCRRHSPSSDGSPFVREHEWCGDYRPNDKKNYHLDKVLGLSKLLAEIHVGDGDCLGKAARDLMEELKDTKVNFDPSKYDC